MRKQIFKQPDFIPVFDNYEYFNGKTVGITGGSGVLGSILSARMKKARICFVTYQDDITDTKALADWFTGNHFDYIFHFASIVPITEVSENPLRAFDVNSIGTYYLCRELVKSQPECRLFISSSSHVYKDGELINEDSQKKPITIYGKSKLLAEELSQALLDCYDISYSIGRIFSFTHQLQQEPYLVPSVWKKIESVAENSSMEIFNPDSRRDILDAETVMDCILFIAVSDFNGIVNIGSGKGKKIIDIAEHIANLQNKNIKITGKNINNPNSLVADVSLLKKIISERYSK